MRQRTSGSGGVRSRGGQHGEGLQVVVHPREDRLVRHRLAEVGNRLAERDAEQAGSLDGSGGVGAADDRGEHLANAVAERPDGAGNDGVRLELECIGLPVLRGAGLGQQRFDHRQRAAAPCGVGRLGEPGGDPVQQHVCGGDALRGAELGELFDDADRVVGVLVGRAGVGPGELPEQVEHIGQQRVVGAGADAGQAGAAPADVDVGQPALPRHCPAAKVTCAVMPRSVRGVAPRRVGVGGGGRDGVQLQRRRRVWLSASIMAADMAGPR